MLVLGIYFHNVRGVGEMNEIIAQFCSYFAYYLENQKVVNCSLCLKKLKKESFLNCFCLLFCIFADDK